MPYVNRAQQAAFHAKLARGEISPAVVKEFDDATDFSSLPDGPKKKRKKYGSLGKYLGDQDSE